VIATGAQPILDARLKGMKPSGMILVSLVGEVPTPNHVVHAKAGTDYDWRWVHGLDVALVVDDSVDWPLLLKDVAMHRPDYLCVWHRVGNWGAKVYLIPTADDVLLPPAQWQYELDFLAWLDFQNEHFAAGFLARDNRSTTWN
jgi:hypothetical protein